MWNSYTSCTPRAEPSSSVQAMRRSASTALHSASAPPTCRDRGWRRTSRTTRATRMSSWPRRAPTASTPHWCVSCGTTGSAWPSRPTGARECGGDGPVRGEVCREAEAWAAHGDPGVVAGQSGGGRRVVSPVIAIPDRVRDRLLEVRRRAVAETKTAARRRWRASRARRRRAAGE